MNRDLGDVFFFLHCIVMSFDFYLNLPKEG